MRFVVSVASMLAIAGALAGCHDSTTAPRDQVPPAAPRGFFSVTGDHKVYLHWLANTESDLAGYRVYSSPCANGPDCPYDLVGATAGADFVVSDLPNGHTLFFAVAAYDRAGNESDLTYDDVFDTPRPEGFGQVLTDATTDPATSGWDFSAYQVLPDSDSAVDIYYARSGGVNRAVAPFTDTEIQDAGYASTLDAVDFAPTTGWAPSGTVELIAGHCYVVWALDHYAKFRVTSVGSGRMTMDWAYQVDPGNRELRARPAHLESGRVRRLLALAR